MLLERTLKCRTRSSGAHDDADRGAAPGAPAHAFLTCTLQSIQADSTILDLDLVQSVWYQ